jgi:D-alanyl-D-alanine carboxypeptidase/D-alanyl-D-alanine-endopeptidase (penicillin-binding protein 4)
VRIEPRSGGTGEQQAVVAQAETETPEQPSPPVEGPPPGESPPGATPPPEEGEAAPRPRRRPVVVAAVFVVVLLVAGGVLAVPYVSNRLGLPWAPNAPKADPPAPREITLALQVPPESAPTPTPAGVGAAIDDLVTDPALGTLLGSVVDPATGTTLWERNADQALAPASTTKLLTSAAALLVLDHDMRFPTKVVAGAEPGTVVLVGGGDVTLSSLPEGEESIFPGAAHLDDLVEQVREATGGQVSRVELDLSAFTGPTEGRDWAPEDVPSTYMVQTQPVMLDGGRTDPTDEGSMGRSDPAGHLVETFAGRLGAEAGGTTTAPEGAKVLGEVWSPPVDELVRVALVESDNLVSEVLARQVAIAEGKQPSFEGAAEATLEVLSRHGVDVTGVELNDGSGLSPSNRIPPATLTQLLAMAASPDTDNEVTVKLRPLLDGLPVAGGSGTLSTRYDQGPATQGRGWVRAKTGTIPVERVHTLAGVVLTEDDRVLVFALMSNGGDSGAPAALDRISARLRGCGCR